MPSQDLLITTVIKIGDSSPLPPIVRTVHAEKADSPPVTVMLPHDSPGCMSCFQIQAGLRSLLKFFLLQPSMPTPTTTPTPTQGAGQSPSPSPAPDFTGLWFYTEDCHGKSAHIPLTGPQYYVDGSLDALFGANQKELKNIHFFNPTGKCVSVQIITGRDITCPPPSPCPSQQATTTAK